MKTAILVILAIITGFMGRRVINGSRVRDAEKSNKDIDSQTDKAMSSNRLEHQESKDKIEDSSNRLDSASDDELASKFDSSFGAMPSIDPFESRGDD